MVGLGPFEVLILIIIIAMLAIVPIAAYLLWRALRK